MVLGLVILVMCAVPLVYGFEHTELPITTPCPRFEHRQAALFRAILDQNEHEVKMQLKKHKKKKRKELASSIYDTTQSSDPLVKNIGKFRSYLRFVRPLAFASYFNNCSIVKMVLDAGATVNELGIDQMTAIHYAVEGGRLDVLTFLKDHGADLESKTLTSTSQMAITPFARALRGGAPCCATIVRLIQLGASISEREAESGLNALHIFASLGNLEIVTLLLNKAAFVNDGAAQGKKTPLWKALNEGRSHLLDILFEYGADLNYHTFFGTTILDEMSQKQRYSTCCELLKRGAMYDSRNACHKQAKADLLSSYETRASACYIKALKALFNRNLVNFKKKITKAKLTQLHIGSESLLIWTITQRWNEGLEAILERNMRHHGFVRRLGSSIKGLLVPGQVDIDLVNAQGAFVAGDGKTPLMVSVLCDNRYAYSRLLQHGAKPGVRDSQGLIAFNHAINAGRLDLMKSMLFDEQPNVYELIM